MIGQVLADPASRSSGPERGGEVSVGRDLAFRNLSQQSAERFGEVRNVRLDDRFWNWRQSAPAENLFWATE
jgi:predicted DNA-binding ribbon-helix-helix protein